MFTYRGPSNRKRNLPLAASPGHKGRGEAAQGLTHMTIPTQPRSGPEPDLAKLRLAISEDRFRTYLATTAGDELVAWRLYEWGLAAASGFQLPLHALEITLRNAMHDAIAQVYGSDWLSALSAGPNLRRVERDMIAQAAERLRREAKVATPPAMIAALPFGFWVALLASHHDQGLWRTAGHRAFHGRHRRRHLHEDLERVRTLRNRIAHHEHLLNRNLEQDARRVERLLMALNPDVGLWVDQRSTLSQVLGQRPTTPASTS